MKRITALSIFSFFFFISIPLWADEWGQFADNERQTAYSEKMPSEDVLTLAQGLSEVTSEGYQVLITQEEENMAAADVRLARSGFFPTIGGSADHTSMVSQIATVTQTAVPIVSSDGRIIGQGTQALIVPQYQTEFWSVNASVQQTLFDFLGRPAVQPPGPCNSGSREPVPSGVLRSAPRPELRPGPAAHGTGRLLQQAPDGTGMQGGVERVLVAYHPPGRRRDGSGDAGAASVHAGGIGARDVLARDRREAGPEHPLAPSLRALRVLAYEEPGHAVQHRRRLRQAAGTARLPRRTGQLPDLVVAGGADLDPGIVGAHEAVGNDPLGVRHG